MGDADILVVVVIWSWILLHNGRRRTSWQIAWISCILALTFIVGDIYQRAGNTLLSRKFAEKVSQTVHDSGRLGTLDDHIMPFYSTLGGLWNTLKLKTRTNFSKMPIITLSFLKNPIFSKSMKNTGGRLSPDIPIETDNQHIYYKADKYKVIQGWNDLRQHCWYGDWKMAFV